MYMKNRIDEYAGVFNDCEQTAIRISNRIFNEWFTEDGEPIELSYCFVEPCSFGNNGYVSVCQTKFNVRAAYILDIKQVRGDSVILVNLLALDPNNKESFVSSLMHELTHLYRDNMKRKKGTSELDYAHKSGYFKAFDYYFKEKNPIELKRKISQVLYKTSQLEVPAFIAGLYGSLRKYGDDLKTVDDVLYALYNSREYTEFASSLRRIDNWMNTTDPQQQKLLVQYLDELTANNIKTFGQFKKYMMVRYYKTKNKLDQLIPKMVTKYFYDKEEAKNEGIERNGINRLITEAIDSTIAHKLIADTLENGNDFLSKYGMSVVFNPNYNFQRNDYYRQCVAIYQTGSVKNNGKIRIGINLPYIEKYASEDEYETQISISVWHEIGHGIIEYLKGLRRKDTQCGTKVFRGQMLKDFRYILSNEEDCVEDFGYIMGDPPADTSDLLSFLQDYENEILKLKNQEGGSKWMNHFIER